MKLLETLRIRAASAARRRAARFGVGERPARLDLRLDGFDAPTTAGAGAALRVDQWQERLVEYLQWVGPTPVRITAHAGHPFLPDLARFCHRVEMPVTVRTGPAGLDVARAEELLDRGMHVCELVTERIDAEAEAALRALVHARHDRALPLTVHVHVPIHEGSADGARGVFAAARGLGADAVVLCPPWQGVALGPSARAGVAAALGEGWPLQGTGRLAREVLVALAPGGPGAPRSGGNCALGGTRLVLEPDGAARVCPFHPGLATGPLAESGAALAAHRAAIRRCDRRCGHPELV